VRTAALIQKAAIRTCGGNSGPTIRLVPFGRILLGASEPCNLFKIWLSRHQGTPNAGSNAPFLRFLWVIPDCLKGTGNLLIPSTGPHPLHKAPHRAIFLHLLA